jgi:hypothetical protein
MFELKGMERKAEIEIKKRGTALPKGYASDGD